MPLSKKTKKQYRRLKKTTKARVVRGDPPDRAIPNRRPKKAGDSVITIRARKSGPNKGKRHPIREYRGPDGKVHSAPAVPLPKSQMKGTKRKSTKAKKTKKIVKRRAKK